MLKYFYKTFLVTILCGSLLMLDFSMRNYQVTFGMQSAHAATQTVSTGGADDGGMAATLEMAAIGLVASRLWKYGKLTPDVMVAAAGGAAFVAGEILAYLKLKEAKQKIETAIQTAKNGDMTDEQRQNIIRLIQMYQAAKDTAETKKNLQLAAAAAFAAAGVMAYFYTAEDTMEAYTCQAALTGGANAALNTVLATCTALDAQAAMHDAICANPYGGEWACPVAAKDHADAALCHEQHTTCTAAVTAEVSTFNSYLAARLPPAPSCSALSTVTTARATWEGTDKTQASVCSQAPYVSAVAGVTKVCMKVTPTHMKNETGCSAVGAGAYNKPQFKYDQTLPKLFLNEEKYAVKSKFKMLDFIKNSLFIPNAKADLFSPMGIASSAAIALVMGFSTTIATTVDINILVPSRRGIIWGVMAAGAFAASSATGSAIEQIQGDIDKLNNLLNTINSQASGNNTASSTVQKASTSGSTSQTNAAISINGTQSDVDISEGGKYKLPCLTGDGANGKCDSVSSQLNKPEVLSSLPEGIKTDVLSIGKMADGLNNTSKISGSTLASASSVAASANALKAALNKQKLETQKILKDNGSSTDLDKESKDAQDALNKSFNDSLKNSKSKLSDVYASLGSNFSSGSSSSAVGTDAKKSAAVIAPKVTTPVSSSIGSGSKMKMVDTKLDEDKNATAANAVADGDKKATSIDDYEIKNDITTDKSSNIFDVISTRYQKSGYPRLFKRISE